MDDVTTDRSYLILLKRIRDRLAAEMEAEADADEREDKRVGLEALAALIDEREAALWQRPAGTTLH